MSNLPIWIFLALLTKHFVVDFLGQVPYHYENKGIYGHPGGIQHAAFHTVGTAVVFFFAPISIWWFVFLALLDGVVHYHIDWAKMNVNAFFNLRPNNSEKFWWLLGFDQYLHHLTYAFITFIAIQHLRG